MKNSENKKPFIEIPGKDVIVSLTDTAPIEGYRMPENFPNCCNYHKSVISDAREWFERFPDCCETHKELKQKPWFDKKTLDGLPEKIINQLSYTEYHIHQQINSPGIDWYKDITDYIEWNIFSFGQLGQTRPGLDRYLKALKHYLKAVTIENYLFHFPNSLKAGTNDLSKENRQRLIEFVDKHLQPVKTQVPLTNPNILYATFQKWLKSFPDLLYFRQLREHTKDKFPMNLVLYEIESNPYSGLTKSKIRTDAELVDLLVTMTKELLQGIDATELLKHGYITDVDKHTFEVINETHRIKQAALVGEYSKGETRYVKIIKKWLSNEKAYFKDIQQLLKDAPQLVGQSKIDQPQTVQSQSPAKSKHQKATTKVWVLYYWYLQEAGLFDGLHNAKMKTVKELAQKHGISKQKFYRSFNAVGRESNEDNPKRNLENIERVIPMLEGFPQAKQLAKDELEKLKKKFTR